MVCYIKLVNVSRGWVDGSIKMVSRRYDRGGLGAFT